MRIEGGIKVGPDSRVHCTFGHNPSSLRLCSFDPNMQQIPRGGGDEWERWVKDMFVAPTGATFWARDYSGIEAVLVGFFAGDPGYVRLAKRDVHTFYTAYALNALGDSRVPSADLPELHWSDEKLFGHLGYLKTLLKAERNSLYKHLVHGANYLQTPHGASEHIFKTTGKAFDRKLIANVMGIYFDLFPAIRQWHFDLTKRVDGMKREAKEGDPFVTGVCHVKNPFGYVHRFYNVLEWKKVNGEWFSAFGEDAKRLVSFLPQSTAAAIIKKAAKRIFYERPDVGATLRLLIHDEVFGEAMEAGLENCLVVSKEIMESPIEELPLDPKWNMGEFLVINTEAKHGPCWGSMEEAA